jgi:hypothetical protein
MFLRRVVLPAALIVSATLLAPVGAANAAQLDCGAENALYTSQLTMELQWFADAQIAAENGNQTEADRLTQLADGMEERVQYTQRVLDMYC